MTGIVAHTYPEWWLKLTGQAAHLSTDYSDLGPEICQEINSYNNYLNFSYQSDTCGLYDNYWRCFFEMLSTCFGILASIKKKVDDILYQQYSA